MEYTTYLKEKAIKGVYDGFDAAGISPLLYPFQSEIVNRALKCGRFAVFADCGLGKTLIQLEWARHVGAHTDGKVLIVAPLAVSRQTILEAKKLEMEIGQYGAGFQIEIINYESLHKVDRSIQYSGIVLDESSILKSYGGHYRKELTDYASTIPFRLCCTATPAPNDLVEIINHSEFLGVMKGKEAIALFFTQDGNTTHSWRLKGHAKKDFWKWMATWCVAIRKPSDLGDFSDEKFILPKLNVLEHRVEASAPEGMLFPVHAGSVQERRAARRASLDRRVEMAADIASKNKRHTVIWCDLNSESESLAKTIKGSKEIRGSQTMEYKERTLAEFSDGLKKLVTKPTIAGFGLNWQHCNEAVFVGLSDSFEQYYQAVRRCWRFGQKKPVNIHIVISEAEGAVLANIQKKEAAAAKMFEEIVANMKEFQAKKGRQEMKYDTDTTKGEGWKMMMGDCVERSKEIESESVGMVIFSPPFPGMYVYSNSVRDIGNSESLDPMIEHFSFLVPELIRVLQPGRLCCVHLMQLTAMKSRDGYIGVKDYRGRVIDMFEKNGLPYAGEVTIDKNPQIQATRNKDRGLLFKSLATDSSMMRMALADYLIYFRKPGENKNPIKAGVSEKYNKGGGWITEEEWIEWAAPVWYRHTKAIPGGIRETDVLNVRQARETDDERHLCPLQLGVVERAVKLWSAPGDLIFSPFAGIGSEGFEALKHNRKFVGIELKESYFRTACENLGRAESLKYGELFQAAK